MKIRIHQETIAPMTAWLKTAKEQGIRDEQALRRILSMPDYGVEFQRYADPNLPVCGIGFEEAVHFCNNAATVGKPARYPGPTLGMDEEGWQFYREQHDELIGKVLSDGERAKDMTMEQVQTLVGSYEQFTFTSLKTGQTRTVMQYPTYYAGCCLWGSIELALGKERLFAALNSFDGFPEAYQEARHVLNSQ